jgi:hypothetical protein
MTVLLVYLRLYAGCLRRALAGITKSPWTLLLPMALLAVGLVASQLLGAAGLIGGLLLALLLDALVAGYLYVVGEVVSDARVRVTELQRSFGPYFWAVLNLFFLVWIVELLLSMALQRNPQALYIQLIVRFAAFVLLNATPEVIYQRHTYGGVATVQRSISFIHANWIEWFIPNLALGAAAYFGAPYLLGLGVPALLVSVVAGALLHLVMVFRGHLFAELDSSSHRQRLFKYRTQP